MKLNVLLSLFKTILLLASIMSMRSVYAQADSKKKKVLFVVTSHNQKGNTGEATGYYLSEVTHPWNELIAAGYEVDFVSPNGGKAPVDGFDLSDPINRKFWENTTYHHKIEHTMKPSEVIASNYLAIHYAGGHGAMWDFAGNTELAVIAASIYENGGIVSAVCHGPAGLVNIKLQNGKYLVDGKKINAFTNEEEVAVKLDKIVPFLLETKLTEQGARFERSAPWQPHVTVDQRVITGQNPQSAKAVGAALVQELGYLVAFAQITRYDVKQQYRQAFQKALYDYAADAGSLPGYIMTEAYSEEGSPSTSWIIERWADKRSYENARGQATGRAIASLSAKALLRSPTTIPVTDLEPFPEQDWHPTAQHDTDALTIMLFVDAKPGTEPLFKDVYHAAMPQFRSEPGVINYQLSQLKNDKARFVTYEKFRGESAFQYHLNFPPIQAVIDYLNTNIKEQPFQLGLHRLKEIRLAGLRVRFTTR